MHDINEIQFPNQSNQPVLFDQRPAYNFREDRVGNNHAAISDNDRSFDLLAKPDELGLGINHQAIQQSKIWHNVSNEDAVVQSPDI